MTDSIKPLTRCKATVTYGNQTYRCSMMLLQDNNTSRCALHTNAGTYPDWNDDKNVDFEMSKAIAYNTKLETERLASIDNVKKIVRQLPRSLVQTTIERLRNNNNSDLSSVLTSLGNVIRNHNRALAEQLNETKQNDQVSTENMDTSNTDAGREATVEELNQIRRSSRTTNQIEPYNVTSF